MRAWQAKLVLNGLNGSTLCGLAVAAVGRADLAAGPRGLLLATGFRIPFPPANAFTVGNVVVTRHGARWLEDHPRVLLHEERHSWQYVACLGLPLVPLYLLAAGWSHLRAGDRATHNLFERLAGLEDGGYRA